MNIEFYRLYLDVIKSYPSIGELWQSLNNNEDYQELIEQIKSRFEENLQLNNEWKQSLITKTLNYAKYQNKFISKKVTDLLPERIYSEFWSTEHYQNIMDFIYKDNQCFQKDTSSTVDIIADFDNIQSLDPIPKAINNWSKHLCEVCSQNGGTITLPLSNLEYRYENNKRRCCISNPS